MNNSKQLIKNKQTNKQQVVLEPRVRLKNIELS